MFRRVLCAGRRPLVSLVAILLPIVAGLLLFAIPKDDRVVPKALGCVVAAITFVLLLLGPGDVNVHWLARPFTASFHFAASGLGLWISLLLALSTFCAVLATNLKDQRNFVAQMLLLEGSMVGVFLAPELLVFARFWDFML